MKNLTSSSQTAALFQFKLSLYQMVKDVHLLRCYGTESDPRAVDLPTTCLRECSNPANTILEHIEYGIIFLDPDLNIKIVNRSAKKMFNLPDDFINSNPTVMDMFDYHRYAGIFNVESEVIENDALWEAFKESRREALLAGNRTRKVMQGPNDRYLSIEISVLPDNSRMPRLL